MKLVIYGGCFNPPHNGHVDAARMASRMLAPDRFLFIPTAYPPHKALPADTPDEETRLALTRLAFGDIPNAEISDMELTVGGISYTSETLKQLQIRYPGAELCFLMGTDMLLTMETWHDFRTVLDIATLVVMIRQEEAPAQVASFADYLRKTYGARITYVEKPIVAVSSTQVRSALPRRDGAAWLPPAVYGEIIRRRLYGAKPDFAWLREQAFAMLKPGRVPHVRGCEAEAIRLAGRWGADPEEAAEAAILHDCTKRLTLSEQLELCRRYDLPTDELEQRSEKLLHAHTGAAVARDRFGVSDAVFSAIFNHTTGCAGMALLDKIIYMADYIEPTRDFPGLDELRSLAYEDLDAAMHLGIRMTMAELAEKGSPVHPRTLQALAWLECGKKG